MLPFQGAASHPALNSQGGAVGLMITMAFSQTKNATTWQHNISPTAKPWVYNQPNGNALGNAKVVQHNALKGQYKKRNDIR